MHLDSADTFSGFTTFDLGLAAQRSNLRRMLTDSSNGAAKFQFYLLGSFKKALFILEFS